MAAMREYRVVDGDRESLVDVLSTELAIMEAERDSLAKENRSLHRQVAHLRVELGEEPAA